MKERFKTVVVVIFAIACLLIMTQVTAVLSLIWDGMSYLYRNMGSFFHYAFFYLTYLTLIAFIIGQFYYLTKSYLNLIKKKYLLLIFFYSILFVSHVAIITAFNANYLISYDAAQAVDFYDIYSYRSDTFDVDSAMYYKDYIRQCSSMSIEDKQADESYQRANDYLKNNSVYFFELTADILRYEKLLQISGEKTFLCFVLMCINYGVFVLYNDTYKSVKIIKGL